MENKCKNQGEIEKENISPIDTDKQQVLINSISSSCEGVQDSCGSCDNSCNKHDTPEFCDKNVESNFMLSNDKMLDQIRKRRTELLEELAELDKAESLRNDPTNKKMFEESTHLKKRQRNSYTHDEIFRIIEQDRLGGRSMRHETARIMGMPTKTADNIVSRYHKQDNIKKELHDRRHDRDVHEGRHSKYEDWYKEILLDSLHINRRQTLKQLKNTLNEEILRKIILDHGISLRSDEEKCLSELGERDYLQTFLQDPDVAYEYRRREIKCIVTISTWLSSMMITLKHSLPEKNMMNDDNTKSKRMEYVTKLEPLLRNEDENFVVFVDEMPFYMAVRRSYSRTPRAKTTLVNVPLLTDELNFHTQVAMAVTPSHGLICSSIYPSKPKIFIRKDSRMARPTYSATYNKEAFKEFMNKILLTLNERRSLLSGKNVIIIVDGALESGQENIVPNLLEGCEAYETVNTFLLSTNGTLTIQRTPPNSPQLNLCEYYNRTLRTYTNTIRASREMELQMSSSMEHGEKLKVRQGILNSIIEQGIAQLEEHSVQALCAPRMLEFFVEVARCKGFLDMTTRM